MGYVVNNIPNNNYDLWGIKLDNGKMGIYWKRKNVNKVDDIVIILNNSKGVSVKENQVCISLDGVSKLEDIVTIINSVIKELKIDIRVIKIKVIVDNDKELEVANSLISMGLKSEVEKTVEYQQKIEKNKEQILGNRTFSGNNTIEASNGDKYTELSDGKMVANLGILTNNEQMNKLLEEYLKDPEVSRKFNSGELSREQIIKYLEQKLVHQNNLKSYDMNKYSSVHSDYDEDVKLKNNYAASVGGTYNVQTGIVKSDNGKYQTIDNDGVVRNASVEATTISNSGVVSSSNGNNDYVEYSDSSNKFREVNNLEEEIQKIEQVTDLAIYYLDDSGYVYDKNGDFVREDYGYAKVGDGHYLVDEYNNLVVDGKVKGTIDDIRNMGKKNIDNKPKVYKKEKPMSTSSNNNSSGFVSLPIIIFVISFLLLVGSGIVLFMMK